MIVKYFSERQYTKVSVDEYSANGASRDQTRDFKKTNTMVYMRQTHDVRIETSWWLLADQTNHSNQIA
jgi:hypothetical protein